MHGPQETFPDHDRLKASKPSAVLEEAGFRLTNFTTFFSYLGRFPPRLNCNFIRVFSQFQFSHVPKPRLRSPFVFFDPRG